jgi:RHS repeat-associated protein
VAGIGNYEYREDTKGRLYEVQNAFAQLFRTEYDLDGKLLKRTWANGVTEGRQYTGRDWLQSISLLQANGLPLDGFTYEYTDANGVYDGTGHVQREYTLWGSDHRYSYNDLYELIGETSADFGGLYGSVAYTLDANGNRTSRTVNGTTDYYGIGAGNRLLWVNRGLNAAPTSGQANPYSLFSYNLNGALSARDRRDNNGLLQYLDFKWDGSDRLRLVLDHATQATFFSATYNGDGLRVKKSDTRAGALQQHDYSYGPTGLLWDSNPNTVYTPGFGHRSNGISKFYQTDWLGSTRYVTDSTGNTATQGLRFDAFGQRIAMSGTEPYHATDVQFAGGWGYQTEYSGGASEPGLGLEYLQQRYYDSLTGRFISPDPISVAGGLNLYRYAANEPVGSVDPSGLHHRAEWEMGGGGGGGGGDVSGEQGGQTIGLRMLQLWERIAEKIRLPWESAEEAAAEEEGAAEGSAARRPPNPGGRRGCPPHRLAVAQEEAGWEARGWKLENGGRLPEQKVDLGNGRWRYPDLVLEKGGIRIAIQVGRTTQAGLPVAREIAAMIDLIDASIFDDVIFVPY